MNTIKIGKPAHPIKGRGYRRVPFPFNRGTRAGQARAAFFDALPPEHKHIETYRRKGGYFGHTTTISPEAYELWLVGTKGEHGS